MIDETKEAYELLGFTAEKPNRSGTYICVCMESDYQPYKATIRIGDELVNDPHLGAADLHSYDVGLTDLLYKRVSD